MVGYFAFTDYQINIAVTIYEQTRGHEFGAKVQAKLGIKDPAAQQALLQSAKHVFYYTMYKITGQVKKKKDKSKRLSLGDSVSQYLAPPENVPRPFTIYEHLDDTFENTVLIYNAPNLYNFD